jgi:hypothetical protein
MRSSPQMSSKHRKEDVSRGCSTCYKYSWPTDKGDGHCMIGSQRATLAQPRIMLDRMSLGRRNMCSIGSDNAKPLELYTTCRKASCRACLDHPILIREATTNPHCIPEFFFLFKPFLSSLRVNTNLRERKHEWLGESRTMCCAGIIHLVCWSRMFGISQNEAIHRI